METWFPTFYRLATSASSLTLFWPWWTTIAQRRALLRLIATANEENLPLAPLLEQWANDESGLQQFRVRRLAKLIAEGRALADAAEAVPGVLGDDDILTLRFDAQSGTRTQAARASLENSAAQGSPSWLNFCSMLIYLGFLLLFGVPAILLVQLRVLPRIEHIVSEFGMRRPALLGWSLNALEPYSIHLLVAGFLSLVTAIWLFGTRSGRRLRWSFASKMLRSIRESRSADVLQMLRVAAKAGRPIPGALSTLARYHFDPTIRHQLLVVRNDVEQGTPVWQSMSAVGLISRPESHLLTVAERQGSPAWALDQLVDVKRQRVASRLERAGQLLLPAFVLLIAVLVIFQVSLIFVPLINLMEGLL